MKVKGLNDMRPKGVFESHLQRDRQLTIANHAFSFLLTLLNKHSIANPDNNDNFE